jgi:hypothetical protein
MKKQILFVVFIILFSISVFAIEKPSFLVESIAGYTIGEEEDLSEAISLDFRLSYPFGITGIAVEAGTIIGESSFHLFIGPLLHWQNEKIRILGSIGFDTISLYDKQSDYTGIGTFFEASRIFSKHFYLSIGLEANFYFEKSGSKITGYTDASIGVLPDGTKVYPADANGNIIYQTPVIDNVKSFGNYFIFKPFIVTGFQL